MVQVVVKASSESQGVLVAIFPVKSLLQEWKSLWECILSKPVSEEFKFHPTDCPEKFLSGQSASSLGVTNHEKGNDQQQCAYNLLYLYSVTS